MARDQPAVGRRGASGCGRVARATGLTLLVAVALVSAALAASTTTLRSAINPTLGRILEGPSRYTLYVYCAGTSTVCAGRSSSSWRPLLATGRVVAASGSQIKASKLGTRKLANGQHQVTYYGQPLYLYAKDTKPGQTKGEDKQDGGGAWFVVGTSGRAIPPQVYPG